MFMTKFDCGKLDTQANRKPTDNGLLLLQFPSYVDSYNYKTSNNFYQFLSSFYKKFAFTMEVESSKPDSLG